MNRTIQTILLILAVSISIGFRLSIFGWLFFVGISSSLIFGISHFIIHFYSMNYIASGGYKKVFQAILSHLLLLCILIFQVDFDDARIYSVLGFVFGIESDFLINNSFYILISAIIAYIINSIILVVGAKKYGIQDSNTKYLNNAIIATLLLPIVFFIGVHLSKHYQQVSELEKHGIYSSVSRALKNPNNVKIIKINPEHEKLSCFPTEILQLQNIKEIDLNEQSIKTIPADINKLNNLEVLNMIDNDIVEITPSICDCIKLKELRIGGHISKLPDCMKTMRNLKHLSIQSNTVNELMDELLDFQYLKTAHFFLKEGRFDHKKWAQIEELTGLEHSY